jgi:KaiC/GvpD/RAD55 family RecA-like ATPase
MTLEFELLPLRKYSIKCPRCGDYREKLNTKSLTVYRDVDKYLRWQCWHPGCEWAGEEKQWMKDPRPEDVEALPVEESVKPLKVIGELPTHHEGNQLWWYRNEQGEPLYAVMRKDTGTGKSYHPVTLMDSNITAQLPTWPLSKCFYSSATETDKVKGKVLVVEGEKAADAGQHLFKGVEVITWRGGASNTGTAPWDSLKDKTIYLWPDNDDPGRNAMSRIADLIGSSNTVYMVDTTVFPPKSDLADQLDKILVKTAIKEAKLISKPISQSCTVEDIDEQTNRLSSRFSTGWTDIDAAVSFPSSGVIVLEGRTGHAKTGSAINISYNVLRGGGRVHFFSYEIPASRVVARYARIYEGEGQEDQIKGYIKSRQLNIYDQSKQLPLKKLKEILDSPKMAGSLVVIDYAQIVPCASSEMRNKMIDLMDSLRIAANTHGFVVLLLSQLTPDYANPVNDAPRDAKDIHFSAEMVLRVWNKDNSFGHPLYDEVPGNYTMHVVKNRDGESGHLIGFIWDRGAYLEPNGHIVKAVKPKAIENKGNVALEKIAAILQHQFGGI